MARKPSNQFLVRFPADLKQFVSREAARNGSSQNSEVIRAVRERMDRVEKSEGAGAPTPTPSEATTETLAQEISK